MKELKEKQYFFKHPGMNFGTLIALGSCYYRGADAGEVLSICSRIRDGDFESWYQEWYTTAARVREIARGCDQAGDRAGALWAWLRASNCFATASSMVDGTDDPGRLLPTWKEHRECWDEFCGRLSPPAEKVEIPYENVPMPGYLFRPDGKKGPLPLIIFNNGSDGPVSAMWAGGIAGALERGYAALTFDGPGQNSLLWLHNISFRYDWEKVITPVVDFLLARGDTDPERIVLSGISQGGYWVLRALAFEHRIAAGIADPGVMDVSTAMMEKLPGGMRRALREGDRAKFEKQFRMGEHFMGKAARQELEFRMKPYCTKNVFDWMTEALRYNARDVISEIRCPMLIADPDDEQFWPGQSREVYDTLTCSKTIVRFTGEEGANWHCEPMARGLYDQRVFGWLATVLPQG
ncbi:MAG: alpha/beta fold hydrolase [PVC group bacterium]